MTDEVYELVDAVQRLRNEQNSLIMANGTLLASGINAAAGDVAARLEAIKTAALAAASRLEYLGAHQQAEHAREGWAIVVAWASIVDPTSTNGTVAP